MYYLALILMGILPYYLFGKNFKNYSTLFLGLPLMGLSIYHFDDPTTASTVYKVLELMAFTTSVLTFFLSYRTLNLIKLSYYFVFVNVVALFIFKDKWMFELYFGSLVFSAFSLYLVGYYMDKTFGSANIDAITGIVLKAPKLALFLRLSLMNLGLYPPFANALIMTSNIVKTNIGVDGYLIVFWLFFANFFMAFRILNSSLFGKPNQLVNYKDIGQGYVFVFSILFLVLTAVGFYSLMEVLL
ncbi:MAG: hypothetical protein ACP5S8_02525 [Hydrogenobaculum sp.]|nr:MAG: hypothetical protein C0170_01635 [Hydrogenobaculum sp.]HEK25421.1 hypothetical protein [Hydrogenobaculum sp.]